MASLVFNVGAYELRNGGAANFSADDIEIILVKSSYTPNKDDTNAVYATAELGAISGYVPGWDNAGRKTLGSKTITNDTTNDRTVYDADNPSMWTLATGETIGGAIVGKKGTADDSDAIPLFFVDCTDTPTNGGTFTFQFSASGVAYTAQ